MSALTYVFTGAGVIYAEGGTRVVYWYSRSSGILRHLMCLLLRGAIVSSPLPSLADECN